MFKWKNGDSLHPIDLVALDWCFGNTVEVELLLDHGTDDQTSRTVKIFAVTDIGEILVGVEMDQGLGKPSVQYEYIEDGICYFSNGVLNLLGTDSYTLVTAKEKLIDRVEVALDNLGNTDVNPEVIIIDNFSGFVFGKYLAKVTNGNNVLTVDKYIHVDSVVFDHQTKLSFYPFR